MCRDMHSFSAQHSRVDLSELKLQIVSKIGEKKTRQYLGHLNRFLGQNLSKSEFNRLCLLILGRENVKLHNRLIRSILSNVYRAKIPPPPLHVQDSAKPFEETGRDHTLKIPIGRRMAAHSILRENGTLKRPAQEQYNQDMLPEKAAKRTLQEKPLLDQGNALGKQRNSSIPPLKAPLGIPLCKASIGGARILPPIASRYNIDDVSFQDDDLMKRMEDIAESQELKGVAMDCATLLNSGLDAYLKRLIKSCIDLRRPPCSRHLVLQQEQQYQQQQVQQQTQGKLSNGLQPTIEEHYSVSMLDFNVAIQLNSWQLVEDRPLLQEKIQCHFQE